jgi:hypothetical protein
MDTPMITNKSRITTIVADVTDEDTIQSSSYRRDSGALFTPQRVTLTLTSPADRFTNAVTVVVTGAGFLKSGKPSQQEMQVTYSSGGGGEFTKDLPLSEMPAWLSDWVQSMRRLEFAVDRRAS